MSAIKRAIEDLSITVAEAIYTECFDMPECLEWTISDVEEDALNALTTGKNVDYLLNYMKDMLEEYFDPSDPDRFKLTISTIKELEAFMN